MAIPKGKRSGGPKTPAGRSVASRNAISHGAYASPANLTRSDNAKARFDVFAKAFVQDLAPKGQTQVIVAGQIAAEAWRMLNLAAYEQRGLDGAALAQPSAKDIHEELGLDWPERMLYLFIEPMEELIRLMQGDPVLSVLNALKTYGEKHLFAHLGTKDNNLYSRIEFIWNSLQHRHTLDLVPDDLARALARVDSLGYDALPELFPTQELELSRSRAWIVEHQSWVENARQSCIARRMLQEMTDSNLLRARTNINQTFFALMGEYRDLQKMATGQAKGQTGKAT